MSEDKNFGIEAALAEPEPEPKKPLTYREVWDRYVKPFEARVKSFSKEAIADVLVIEAWNHSTLFATSTDDYVEKLQAGLASVIEKLKKAAPGAASENRWKRYKSWEARMKSAQISRADCNACDHWRERKAKKKGTRIPGGKGKCSRPGGHCRPSKVRE